MRSRPRLIKCLKHSIDLQGRNFIHGSAINSFMTSSHAHQTRREATLEDVPDYTRWSNDDLIKRVTDLETQLRVQNNKHFTSSPSNTLPVLTKKKPKKVAKQFDPSKYNTRHVALKFAYLGKHYNGFEHHTNNTTPLPTVEEELWKALRKTKLIFPVFREGQSEDDVCWDGCEYSKCGRTDRGVSAFGQVVGLRVRSSRPKKNAIEKGLQTNDELSELSLDKDNEGGISDITDAHEETHFTPKSAWDPVKDELPYIQLLNRVLPSDIRVLAWCPNPPQDFSARFNCKERQYRYFFTNPAYIPSPHSVETNAREGWLNIAAMQQAAKKLEGLHDFRNFCKVDPSKQITNFQRRIFHASIECIDSDMQPGTFLKRPSFACSEPLRMYYFEVHGSAFLWHQVRHMVAILFLVGQGYETPDVVDRLLDVEGCAAKPVYEMADDVPLVLWDCVFPNLENVSTGDHGGSVRHHKDGGYQDALEWIHVGERDVAGARAPSLTEAMQDRKYGRLGIMEDLWAQWRKYKMDEALAASLMNVVAGQGETSPRTSESNTFRASQTSARVFDGSETPRNVGMYVPIMHRDRMEKPEVLNARYALRKGLSGTTAVNGDADMDD